MKLSLPLDLLRALDLFALERLPDHTFMALSPPPPWVRHALTSADAGQPLTLANAFPFLDRFLTEADAFWRGGSTDPLGSASFVAPGAEDDVLLRAWALNLGPRSVLVLERLKGEADTRQMLQKSRDNKLQQERLERQIEAMKGPLDSIASLLARLRESELDEAQRQLVDQMGKALTRMQGK
jgi:hypothetical protein